MHLRLVCVVIEFLNDDLKHEVDGWAALFIRKPGRSCINVMHFTTACSANLNLQHRLRKPFVNAHRAAHTRQHSSIIKATLPASSPAQASGC